MNNITHISTNPRFKRQTYVPLHPNFENAELVRFTMVENIFGFISGDILICRTDFNSFEITERTLVITNDNKIRSGLKSGIKAVVCYFIREVTQ